MRLRLSLLMFLQYAAPGAVLPLFSLYLHKDMGLSDVEVGWVSATQAVGALSSPLLAGQVADRWIPAERCLLLYAVTSGVLFFLIPTLSSFPAILIASLFLWLGLSPAITLGTTICFTHLTTPERHFGAVRLWGTVGWMVVTWCLAGWLAAAGRLRDAFLLGGVLAFLLAAYALTLPHTPPGHRRSASFAPLAAARLLRERSFAVFVLGSFCVSITSAAYSQTAPLLLANLGLGNALVGTAMTVGQISEIATLGLLPMILLRLEMRGTMLLGLVCWSLGLAVLVAGTPVGLVVAALTSWGTVVSCYLVAGQVFVNGRARGDIRASAQALLTCSNATGMLLGNLAAGGLRALNHGAIQPVFLFCTIIVAFAVLVFLLGFRPQT